MIKDLIQYDQSLEKDHPDKVILNDMLALVIRYRDLTSLPNSLKDYVIENVIKYIERELCDHQEIRAFYISILLNHREKLGEMLEEQFIDYIKQSKIEVVALQQIIDSKLYITRNIIMALSTGITNVKELETLFDEDRVKFTVLTSDAAMRAYKVGATFSDLSKFYDQSKKTLYKQINEIEFFSRMKKMSDNCTIKEQYRLYNEFSYIVKKEITSKDDNKILVLFSPITLKMYDAGVPFKQIQKMLLLGDEAIEKIFDMKIPASSLAELPKKVIDLFCEKFVISENEKMQQTHSKILNHLIRSSAEDPKKFASELYAYIECEVARRDNVMNMNYLSTLSQEKDSIMQVLGVIFSKPRETAVGGLFKTYSTQVNAEVLNCIKSVKNLCAQNLLQDVAKGVVAELSKTNKALSSGIL